MKNTMLLLLTVLFAGPALAQTNATFLLVSSNTVSPTAPTTTIEIWAVWTDTTAEFVFTRSDYDLIAGDGAFSNPANVLNGPGSTAGVIAGNMIVGAQNGQLHTPPFGLILVDNPILLATYEWTTSDFTPRSIALETSNTANFLVAWYSTGAVVSLFPQDFTPGSGVITVVPAPAAGLVLALPFVVTRRRRRC